LAKWASSRFSSILSECTIENNGRGLNAFNWRNQAIALIDLENGILSVIAIFRQLGQAPGFNLASMPALIQGLSCRKSLLHSSAAVRLGLPQQIAIF
jgi:hypothetical protein